MSAAVPRRLRRSGEEREAAHPLRKAHPPLPGLLGAHREAERELDALDAEIVEETALRLDVVADREIRERSLEIARRG